MAQRILLYNNILKEIIGFADNGMLLYNYMQDIQSLISMKKNLSIEDTKYLG